MTKKERAEVAAEAKKYLEEKTNASKLLQNKKMNNAK